MDRFKVTGEELRHFYKENVELARVFNDIENDLRATNQVVCRYVVNGLEISEADEVRFQSVSLEQIETLEYLTDHRENLITSVLSGWIKVLPEMMQQTEDLSQKIRAQGIKGHLRSVSDLVENFQFLIDSVMSVRNLAGDQFLVNCPVDWSKSELQSKKTILETFETLKRKEFVLLADVLEYDLNNLLQMWMENLQRIENTILGKATNGENTGSYIRLINGIHERFLRGISVGPDGQPRYGRSADELYESEQDVSDIVGRKPYTN